MSFWASVMVASSERVGPHFKLSSVNLCFSIRAKSSVRVRAELSIFLAARF